VVQLKQGKELVLSRDNPGELAAETPDTLSDIRSGFRAKYLIDAAEKVLLGTVNLDTLKYLPIEAARKQLLLIKGVGAKVAECTLLYGIHRTEAFPVDVWIKRVMSTYYPDEFPEFAAKSAGIAQQYLFHYIRNVTKF